MSYDHRRRTTPDQATDAARSARAGAGRVYTPVQRKPAREPVDPPGRLPFLDQMVASERLTAGAEDPTAVAAAGVQGGGSRLPHAESIQSAFGHHDVSDVRAHVGGTAADAATAIGGEAFALGRDVAFRSEPDVFLAAHEAAHVVQQRGGLQLKSADGADGAAHERHADAVAARVASGQSAQSLLDEYAPGAATSGSPQHETVQRKAPGPADPAAASGATLVAARSLRERLVPGRDAHAAIDALTFLAAAIEADTTPLAPAEISAIEAALGDAETFAARLSPDDSSQLNDVVLRVAFAGKNRGADLAPQVGVARVAGPAAKDEPTQRLAAIEATVGAHAATVETLLSGLPDVRDGATPLADHAQTIAALLREARAVVVGSTGVKIPEATEDAVNRLSTRVDTLWRWGRLAEVPIVDVRAAFDAEAALRDAVRAKPLERIGSYSVDVRVERGNPMSPTGGELVDRILDRIFDQKLGQMLAIDEVETILQEPPPPLEPSMFERVITLAAAGFVGTLPGRLGSLLGGMLTMGSAPSAGRDELLTTVLSIGAGAISTPTEEIVPSGRGGRALPPIKTRFLNDCRARARAYFRDINDAKPRLRDILVATPPAALNTMVRHIDGGALKLAEQMRTDLLLQWMNVRAGAAQGVDASGNLQSAGTLQDQVEDPGTVKISLRVKNPPWPVPQVTVVSARTEGIEPAVVRELATARRSLMTTPLHRFVSIEIPDTYTGALMPVGTLYLSPTHALDLSDVSWRALARIVNEGKAPDSGTRATDPAERLYRIGGGDAAEADARQGAYALLAQMSATTADLEG